MRSRRVILVLVAAIIPACALVTWGTKDLAQLDSGVVATEGGEGGDENAGDENPVVEESGSDATMSADVPIE